MIAILASEETIEILIVVLILLDITTTFIEEEAEIITITIIIISVIAVDLALILLLLPHLIEAVIIIVIIIFLLPREGPLHLIILRLSAQGEMMEAMKVDVVVLAVVGIGAVIVGLAMIILVDMIVKWGVGQVILMIGHMVDFVLVAFLVAHLIGRLDVALLILQTQGMLREKV